MHVKPCEGSCYRELCKIAILLILASAQMAKDSNSSSLKQMLLLLSSLSGTLNLSHALASKHRADAAGRGSWAAHMEAVH